MAVEHHPDHEDGWTVLYQERPVATLVFTGRGIEDVGLLFSLTEDSRPQELENLCRLSLLRDATFQNNRTKNCVPGVYFPLMPIDGLVALRDQRPNPSSLSRAVTEIGQFFNVTTTVISVVLTLAILALNFSDWMFGRTVQLEFGRVPSSHLKQADFEAEFTRRVSAYGYVVFNCRVMRNDRELYYSGWITLREVTASDRQVDRDLRDVMASFTDKPLQVEKPIPPP